ncbi:methyltransferase domain-containing protein [Candidatus Micrarchaeota archaeon]|nr:methyltransferase domain-containing protein [Candidatus Micrarchaeota archaeon]MBU1929892.1 methyltransferase domain-containing protein [Candidatus Micrarchaeota archaeon]
MGRKKKNTRAVSVEYELWFEDNSPCHISLRVDPIGESLQYSVAQKIVLLFSKKGDWVLDPFAGFGTVLEVCQKNNRKCMGIERQVKRVHHCKKKIKSENIVMLEGDALKELKKLKKPRFFDFCLMDPPFFGFLYTNGKKTKNYSEHLSFLQKIFKQVFKKLRRGSYCIVGTKNVYKKGRLFPLACDLAHLLKKAGFKPFPEIVRVRKKIGRGGRKETRTYFLLVNQKK